MSQLRKIGVRVRAAIAVIAAWALMFSVATSGAVAASANDIVFSNNHASARAGLFACFKRHMTQGVAADEKAPDGGRRSSKAHHCPCCLAAHAGAAAVLPERISAVARPPEAPAPFDYVAISSRDPKSVTPRTVNGARAPPA